MPAALVFLLVLVCCLSLDPLKPSTRQPQAAGKREGGGVAALSDLRLRAIEPYISSIRRLIRPCVRAARMSPSSLVYALALSLCASGTPSSIYTPNKKCVSRNRPPYYLSLLVVHYKKRAKHKRPAKRVATHHGPIIKMTENCLAHIGSGDCMMHAQGPALDLTLQPLRDTGGGGGSAGRSSLCTPWKPDARGMKI